MNSFCEAILHMGQCINGGIVRSSSENFVLIHWAQVTCKHSSNLGRSLMPKVCEQNTHLVAIGLELFDDIEFEVDSDCKKRKG